MGSGTGRLADHLKKSGCLYIGAEFSKEMSQISRDKGHYTVLCDVHRLPMMCESFDIIASAKGVFRYLKPDIAFKECARVLRPNGVLVVHQYARSTWNLRNKQFANPAHLEDEYCLDLYAKNNGLEKISYQKWRSLSFPPYIWPIPKKLKGRWWSQINLYFRKTSKR